MEKNKIILRVGLVIIALSFIFSIGVAFYLKLDNPVFFKNYKHINLYKRDDGIYQESDFTIWYLTNSSDTRTVTDIYFKEAQDLDFRTDEYGFGGSFFPMFNAPQNRKPGKIYGRHSLRTVYIKLYPNNEKQYDGMEIENLVINFDNGDIMEVDIGKIILKEDNVDRDYVSRDGGSSSSDGTASSNYLVKQNVLLEKLDSPFLEKIKDNIDIKVDGKDYREIKGLSYELGDRFSINSASKEPNDIESKYTSLSFDLNLYIKDDDGNIHSTRSHYIDYNNYYFDVNTKDIISYLRARGAI